MDAKLSFDKKHNWITFKPRDKVLIRLHRGYKIPTDRHKKLSPKLQQQYAGPFKVVERIGRLAYKLKLPPTYNIHPVLSVSHLAPWPLDIRGPSNPDKVEVNYNGTPVYKIDKIINKRTTAAGKTQYRVRWSGYDADDDWWMHKDELKNCQEILNEFEASGLALMRGVSCGC